MGAGDPVDLRRRRAIAYAARFVDYPAIQDALLKIDLSWAQELCILHCFFFMWMAKFGAAYGVRTGIHVGVDVMINRAAAAPAGSTCCSACLAGAAFTGIVGTLGATFTWDIGHTDSVSPDLEMPMWIVYLCIPLGSYLMCFRFLQVAWSFWRTATCRTMTSRTSRGSTRPPWCLICIPPGASSEHARFPGAGRRAPLARADPDPRHRRPGRVKFIGVTVANP
jgi:C4-dicarboxylate transporter DctQ subunit